jgi:hypothetical protein
MDGFTGREERQINRTQVSATNFIKYNVTSYGIQYKLKKCSRNFNKNKNKSVIVIY